MSNTRVNLNDSLNPTLKAVKATFSDCHFADVSGLDLAEKNKPFRTGQSDTPVLPQPHTIQEAWEKLNSPSMTLGNEISASQQKNRETFNQAIKNARNRPIFEQKLPSVKRLGFFEPPPAAMPASQASTLKAGQESAISPKKPTIR